MADLKEMLQEIRERTTPEQSQFVSDNMAIVDYIYDLMDKKNMKMNDLARLLVKPYDEVNKWLSGTYNLSLMNLSELAVAMDDSIIITPAHL